MPFQEAVRPLIARDCEPPCATLVEGVSVPAPNTRQPVAPFSAVPLVIATGPGTELRRPLGITIIGGLVVSQVLTLYTTPVIYLLLERLRNWVLGTRRGRIRPPDPARTSLGLGTAE